MLKAMEYDLAVIGAGWAGISAARYAKAQGIKVALLEKDLLGGTCLNRGCIPTKTFLQSARVFSLVHSCKRFGVEVGSAKFYFKEVQARSQMIIKQLSQGLNSLLSGVDFFSGEAEVLDATSLKVADRRIRAKNILIASGSSPKGLEGVFGFEGKKIVSSDEIFLQEDVPESLLIIGGGVIGCECASIFSSLGCKVTLVEKMPQLLPGFDREISQRLVNSFKKRGIIVRINSTVSPNELSGFERVLVSVGRVPNINISGLNKLGVNLEGNRINVDKFLMTNIPNIYAAGDCTAQILMANYAAAQGRLAVWNIIHPQKPRNLAVQNVPNCIFTVPEIASVGMTVKEAESQGISFKIHRFDFFGSAMARILDEAEGFIKIISEQKSGMILGGVIVGPKATELIGILAVAVANGLKIDQVKHTIFGHPTLSEVFSEVVSDG